MRKTAQTGIIHIGIVLGLAVLGIVGYFFLGGVQAGSPQRIFSNLSAALKQNNATFNFTYSDFSPNYKIDISTSSNMKVNLLRNFIQDSSSPLIVDNPQSKYPPYQCGAILYWIVKATDERSNKEIKSSIQKAVVDCSSPVPSPSPMPSITPSLSPSPSLSPTPTTTPIPTPQPCQLSSATWSSTQNPVTEGLNVMLNVNSTGDCVNQQVSFTVLEDDGIGTNPVVINPSNVTFSGSQVQSTWVAEYQEDGIGGISDPPEYYFLATLFSTSQSIKSQDPELQVTKIPTPTPTPIPTNTPAPLTCTPPVPNYKRVFVTSSNYNGNLGGLAGADSKCQDVANATNLGGTWKAWLSDSSISASSRLEHYNGVYMRMDCAVVANNWTDLTDSSLQNPININEKGQLIPYSTGGPAYEGIPYSGAFTSTFANGEIDTDFIVPNGSTYKWWGFCDEWTYGGTSPYYGRGNGQSQATNTFWTDGGGGYCYPEFKLYCFEQ